MDKTTSGFKAAMEGALAIHRGYPANKTALAGKQGGPIPFKTPLEIPGLAGKYKAELDWEGKVVQSCVHCHQVGDAIRTSYRDQGKPIPEEWVYPFPKPETVGLTLTPDSAARVAEVTAGSFAAKAGLKAGDELVSLGGQPLVSPADVSWVLHRAAATDSLLSVVKRGNVNVNVTLTLPEGWRETADISKRAGTWSMRGMALGGLVLEEPTDEERAKMGIAKDHMALRARGVGQYGKHAAAKNAGWQKGDIITELDGLVRSHKPGEKLKAIVLRGDKKVELFLPIQ
jgi:membrane-associated protease RseP (regulator of RpoE activity)